MHMIIFALNDKLSEYILGRISAIVWVISGMPEREYAWDSWTDSEIYHFKCTDEQFTTIVETIDKAYGSVINYEIY